MNKYLMLLVIIPLYAFSEIIHGKDTVIYNNNIVFSPHSLSLNNNYNDTTNHGNGWLVYVCSASIPPIDIFIAEEQIGVCTYICHKLAIGSPRPFYFSKTLFESTNLSAPINLTDTSKFTRYDTLHADPHIRDSAHCYLPHIWVLNRGTGDDQSGNFGIFKNIYGLNILAKFDTIIAIDTVRLSGNYPYLNAYIISWYIQTNGSADFSNIVNVKPAKPRIVSHKNNQNNQAEYFNIRGQRIHLANKSRVGLLIERNDKGVFRPLAIF